MVDEKEQLQGRIIEIQLLKPLPKNAKLTEREISHLIDYCWHQGEMDHDSFVLADQDGNRLESEQKLSKNVTSITVVKVLNFLC